MISETTIGVFGGEDLAGRIQLWNTPSLNQ